MSQSGREAGVEVRGVALKPDRPFRPSIPIKAPANKPVASNPPVIKKSTVVKPPQSDGVARKQAPAARPTAATVNSPQKSKPRYLPYGDAARVLGTIAVVIGHVCDMVVFNTAKYAASSSDWWICNLVDSATRWAVPVYIMLSGSLLLDPARSESPDQFYKKRASRLAVPILFWSTFFIAFGIYYTQWMTPQQAWTDLAHGKPYAHLHFIFRIAGLYAFTPMIRVFLKHTTERMLTLTVFLLLGMSTLDSMLNAWTGAELSAFLRFAPFLGYYLAGYLLRDKRLSRRSLLACWLIAFACIFTLAGGTGLMVQLYGLKPYPSPGMVLYDFLSPVRVTFGICAWLIIVNTFHEGWLDTKLGAFNSHWLAPATLGIYLIHPLFREIIHAGGPWHPALQEWFHLSGNIGFGLDCLWPNVWIGIPLISLMVYIPSVIATLIIMRIPGVRRICG
jgi:surface polysaccharide O-acyltransferase-like enzyme